MVFDCHEEKEEIITSEQTDMMSSYRNIKACLRDGFHHNIRSRITRVLSTPVPQVLTPSLYRDLVSQELLKCGVKIELHQRSKDGHISRSLRKSDQTRVFSNIFQQRKCSQLKNHFYLFFGYAH